MANGDGVWPGTLGPGPASMGFPAFRIPGAATTDPLTGLPVSTGTMGFPASFSPFRSGAAAPPPVWGSPRTNANAPSPNAAPTVAATPTTAPPPPPNVPVTGMSPDALKAQAEMGQEMAKEGMNYGPVRSWTQGMARVADALVGGKMMNDAYQRQMQGYNAAIGNLAGLAGGGGTSGGAGATGNYGAGGPAYGYLASVSAHPDRPGDTANLNPAYAGNLAAAIEEARSQGLNVGLASGFRTPGQTGSEYDAGGNSSHTYGLASDVSGLDGPNGRKTMQWASIAAKHSLYNPYGTGNAAEFNHWQASPYPLEKNPALLASLKAAYATGNMNAVWAATPTTF
jgi:hypothetical protein